MSPDTMADAEDDTVAAAAAIVGVTEQEILRGAFRNLVARVIVDALPRDHGPAVIARIASHYVADDDLDFLGPIELRIASANVGAQPQVAFLCRVSCCRSSAHKQLACLSRR
jgi:hypothetical protein